VIGSETAGGIRNVTASNITAVDTENGIRIKSRRGRGGVIEDLRFDNWTMENVGTGIVVTTSYIMGGETGTTQEPVSERTPAFRNIAISHVTIRGAKQVVEIDGLAEMPIRGLRLTDVIGSGRTGLTARYTDALELHQVQINADHGPAFALVAASDLELDAVTTRQPVAGSPVVRLSGTPGAILRNSHAFPGTGIFLSAAPGELRSLSLENNVLGAAATATEER
jgi:hypothetical protein